MAVPPPAPKITTISEVPEEEKKVTGIPTPLLSRPVRMATDDATVVTMGTSGSSSTADSTAAASASSAAADGAPVKKRGAYIPPHLRNKMAK